MHSQVLTRKSLSLAKKNYDIEMHSPFLKPPITNIAKCLPQIREKKNKTLSCQSNMKSRLSLSFNDSKTPSSESVSSNFSTFTEKHFNFEDPDYCEDLISDLQGRLDSANNSFKSIFHTYLEFFDILINSNKSFSKLLSLLKHGLINSLKSHYKTKISKLQQEKSKQKHIIATLSKEKESLISKLNQLSSQNIDLLSANENIVDKFKKFEDTLTTNPKKRSSILEDLNTKNEKIKELSEKIEEMLEQENKLLQIIEKLNVENLDIEKMYKKTQSHKFVLKKKKKIDVPSIHLELINN